MANPGEAEAILDALGIEVLCDRVVDGETLTAICDDIGVNRGSLRRWVALDEKRMKAMHEARVASAQAFDELAEKEIRAAKSKMALSRARELAHHFRWRASKAAPKEYGDKVELSGDKNAPLVLEMGISRRPALTREEWLAAHGVGTPARPAE